MTNRLITKPYVPIAIYVIQVLILFAGLNVGAAGDGLSVRIETDRSAYYLGQIVMVNVSLVNNSQEAIDTFTDLDPSFGDITLFISDVNGDFKQYLGPDWQVAESEAQLYSIPPSGQETSQFSVLWNQTIRSDPGHITSDYAFSEEGIYEMRVQAYEDVGVVQSNTVTISIQQPQIDHDNAIWQRMQEEPRLALLIQSPGALTVSEGSQALFDELEYLLGKYPESIYASQIDKALSER